MLGNTSTLPYNIDNLYSKFKNNKLSSNKSYLSEVYGRNFYTSNHEVNYYNVEDSKSKRSKKKIAAIVLSTIFCTLGIIGFAFGRNHPTAKGISKGLHKFSNKTKELELKDKFFNFMTNSTNVKDDAWDLLVTKLHDNSCCKFIKNWGDKFTNFEKNSVKKAVFIDYKKSIEAIKKLSGAESIQFTDFEKLYDDIDSSIVNTLKNNRVVSNLFKGNSSNKALNLLTNMSQDNIANKKIIEAGILDKAKLINIPENASQELINAIEKHNRILTDTLIPKLRDLNCGSAPTDVITAAVPIIGLGIGVANADNNEERKSILLDIGFPLIATVSMPLVSCKFPVINGAKAIVAGFAAGQIMSTIAKTIDKITQKAKEKKDLLIKNNL